MQQLHQERRQRQVSEAAAIYGISPPAGPIYPALARVRRRQENLLQRVERSLQSTLPRATPVTLSLLMLAYRHQ